MIERVGDFYHATGQFDRAIAAFAGIIRKQPDRLDLREKLAQVYGAKGDEAKGVSRTASDKSGGSTTHTASAADTTATRAATHASRRRPAARTPASGTPSVRSVAAAMVAVNPAVIPRNHRIEQAIEAAVARQDFAPFEELLRATARPFEEQPGLARYMDRPLPEERVLATFCGT